MSGQNPKSFIQQPSLKNNRRSWQITFGSFEERKPEFEKWLDGLTKIQTGAVVIMGATFEIVNTGVLLSNKFKEKDLVTFAEYHVKNRADYQKGKEMVMCPFWPPIINKYQLKYSKLFKLMGRTLVLGDVHGAYSALIQVFERSGFDFGNDRLISLGDVADRNHYVAECFDELLKVRDLIYILGNHDWWLLEWLREAKQDTMWIFQGGNDSIRSYLDIDPLVREDTIRKHIALLESAPYYYLDDQNRIFVHGGFHPARLLKDQYPAKGKDAIFLWDRDLFKTAYQWSRRKKQNNFGMYYEIFIGHTCTLGMDAENRPLKLANLWALDQGAGWGGKLTLMDVNTHEYWQSDPVSELYLK